MADSRSRSSSIRDLLDDDDYTLLGPPGRKDSKPQTPVTPMAPRDQSVPRKLSLNFDEELDEIFGNSSSKPLPKPPQTHKPIDISMFLDDDDFMDDYPPSSSGATPSSNAFMSKVAAPGLPTTPASKASLFDPEDDDDIFRKPQDPKVSATGPSARSDAPRLLPFDLDEENSRREEEERRRKDAEEEAQKQEEERIQSEEAARKKRDDEMQIAQAVEKEKQEAQRFQREEEEKKRKEQERQEKERIKRLEEEEKKRQAEDKRRDEERKQKEEAERLQREETLRKEQEKQAQQERDRQEREKKEQQRKEREEAERAEKAEKEKQKEALSIIQPIAAPAQSKPVAAQIPDFDAADAAATEQLPVIPAKPKTKAPALPPKPAGAAQVRTRSEDAFSKPEDTGDPIFGQDSKKDPKKAPLSSTPTPPPLSPAISSGTSSSSLSSPLPSIKPSIPDKSAEIEQLNARIRELERGGQNLKSELTVQTNKANDAEKTLSDLQRTTQEKLKKTTDENAALKTEVGELKSQLASAAASKTSADKEKGKENDKVIERLRNELSAKDELLKQEQAQREALTREAAAAREALSKVRDELAREKERAQELEKRSQRLEGLEAELAVRKDESERALKAEKELAFQKSLYETLSKAKEEAEASASKALEDKKELQGRLDKLAAELESSQKQIAKLQEAMNSRGKPSDSSPTQVQTPPRPAISPKPTMPAAISPSSPSSPSAPPVAARPTRPRPKSELFAKFENMNLPIMGIGMPPKKPLGSQRQDQDQDQDQGQSPLGQQEPAPEKLAIVSRAGIPGPAHRRPTGSQRKTAQDALLFWAQERTHETVEPPPSDFAGSWSSGLAFCALLHSLDPTVISLDGLSHETREKNFAAFAEASTKLGVEPFASSENLLKADFQDLQANIKNYVNFLFHNFR